MQLSNKHQDSCIFEKDQITDNHHLTLLSSSQFSTQNWPPWKSHFAHHFQLAKWRKRENKPWNFSLNLIPCIKGCQILKKSINQSVFAISCSGKITNNNNNQTERSNATDRISVKLRFFCGSPSQLAVTYRPTRARSRKIITKFRLVSVKRLLRKQLVLKVEC